MCKLQMVGPCKEQTRNFLTFALTDTLWTLRLELHEHSNTNPCHTVMGGHFVVPISQDWFDFVESVNDASTIGTNSMLQTYVDIPLGWSFCDAHDQGPCLGAEQVGCAARTV